MGDKVTIGYRYSMSIHMGLALGPLDAIVCITAGDKMIWPYVDGKMFPEDEGSGTPLTPDSPLITGTTYTPIDAENIFGGDKGEGGIKGFLTTYMGYPDQVVAADHQAKMGGVVPGFRGVTTCFYTGLICSLNPYPKQWKFRVRRHFMGWDGPVWEPSLLVIPQLNGQVLSMNPAHILYEAATNRDWGRGFPRSRLNAASFKRAAEKLKSENFGLCIRYNRQSGLDEFVELIINHINGVIYTSRETGLLTLDLIRNDYDVNDIPFFTYGSGLLSVDSPEVATREDQVNEVIVKWHDVQKDEERMVRAHNLASIQTLGVKNSTTVEYPGIPTSTLAATIAARDLKVASLSGRRFSLTLDRRAWRLQPGGVFRIAAPDKNIADIVLRAGKVDHGPIESGAITVLAVPDIFGQPTTTYSETQPGYWAQPDRKANMPLYRTLREATYRDIFLNNTRADLKEITTTECYAVGYCVKPSPLSMNFSFYTKTTSENDFIERDNDAFAPCFIASQALSAIATTVTFNNVYETDNLKFPCAAQIDDEIIRIDSVTYNANNKSGTLTIARGCVDTLPESHVIQSAIIVFDEYFGLDRREYAKNEIVLARFQTRTSSENLEISGQQPLSVVMNQRQGRPYSAGYLKVNGQSTYGPTPVRSNTEFKWEDRDRIRQQDKLVSYFDSGNIPETGVSYRLEFFKDDVVYRTVNVIDNNSFVYYEVDADADGAPKNTPISVRLRTFRGSLEARVAIVATFQRS